MVGISAKSNIETYKINITIQKELNQIFNLLKNSNLEKLKQLPTKNMIQNIKILLRSSNLTPQIRNKLKDILKLVQKTIQDHKLQPVLKNLKIFENELKNILMRSTDKTVPAPASKSIKYLDNILQEFVLNDNRQIKQSSIKLLNSRNIIKNTENFIKNLQAISNLVKNYPILKKYQSILDNFIKSVKRAGIKKNLQDLGILYETKKNFVNSKKINYNLKETLLNIKKNNKNSINNQALSKLVDKSILQIQSNQINSIINSNFTSFLPFSWKNLKDGKLSFKYYKKTKNFACKIELNLEKYDNISILLILNENNISIGINTKNLLLRDKIIINLKNFKMQLSSIGLNSNIFLLKNEQEYKSEFEDVIKLGMDIKA